ncbi:MAG: 1-acyl-sn-glycerol-3-phosphate acyltransferase [Deltaproteobacteria bacterium]|nr:1-acyl-sn-glycerol-3-phosphate acyltransferase [Deltaproteobacteria bacterium]
MAGSLWFLINTAQAVVGVTLSAFGILVALLARLVTGSPDVGLWMARRLWAPFLFFGAGARLQVEGLERVDFSKPHLFVVNHQSQIDIAALFYGLPVGLRFLVKDELRQVPFLGWFISAMGMIYIDRRERLKALRQMRRMAGLFDQGQSLVSFPEGSRSIDGSVRTFKNGVFISAIEAGVEVVPMAIEGADRVLPRGGFQVRPGVIRMAIGTPVATRGLVLSDRRRLARQLEGEVRQMFSDLKERSRNSGA